MDRKGCGWDGKFHAIAVTNSSALVLDVSAMDSLPASACNASASPACLSFIALPFSSSPAQCTAPWFDWSSFCLLDSPQDAMSGAPDKKWCSCTSPLSMDSLLPSPFPSTSLSSFLPPHVVAHNHTTASSLPYPSAPSISGWPRGRGRVRVASSCDNILKLSSLASLASSLPSFSSAEKAFVAGAKEDLKVGDKNSEPDGGDAQPFVRNVLASHAKLRKGVSKFIEDLPSDIRGSRKQGFGRAAKRKDSEAVEGLVHGKKSSGERRKKAIQTSQHLLAGAVAAMVSRTFVAPLERLKLEYLVRGAKGSVAETVKRILFSEGVRGFWKGNGMNILRTAPFKSVNFFAYDTYRRQLLKWGDRTEVTNVERLAAGAAAGVTATILCFPLDTLRTLMVAPGGDALGGVIGCSQHLLRTEGFLALYKGLLPAVVSMAPSGAVFYGVYDMLKSSYLSSPEGKKMMEARLKRAAERPEENVTQLQLGPLRTLLFGAIAGACSETVTYPLEVVRRVQQMQNAADKLGMVATIQCLFRKGGVGALYAGLLPSTLQVLPSAALSYFVYESVKIAFKIP